MTLRTLGGGTGGGGGSTPPPLTDVATTATASGALVVGKHNPVDATSGNRAMTLADASGAGQMVSVSKKDSSANTVTVSVAHLRDGGAGSITLVGQYEALLLASKADGTWWPVGDHKTKAYLDTTYAVTRDPAKTSVLVTPAPAATTPSTPTFTPASMADQLFWYSSTTLGANGSQISSWSDGFGVAGAATQSTGANRPTVATVGSGSGKVARFASSQRLASAALAASRNQPVTIALLIKFAATPSATQAIVNGSSINATNIFATSAGLWLIQAHSGAGFAITTTQAVSAAAYQVVIATFNDTSSRIRVDGYTYALPATPGTGPLDRVYIGSTASNLNPFVGDIAEAIAVGHVVTGRELINLESYLITSRTALS